MFTKIEFVTFAREYPVKHQRRLTHLTNNKKHKIFLKFRRKKHRKTQQEKVKGELKKGKLRARFVSRDNPHKGISIKLRVVGDGSSIGYSEGGLA